MTTIADLKNTLHNGLGSRLNKYLIEIPIKGGDSRNLNILCKSAGFPERTMSTTSVFHKGRKYNLRGETDYGGTYEITILDDSKMTYRKLFDKWIINVDNSKPSNAKQSGSSFESAVSGVLNEINAGVDALKMVKNSIENPMNLVDTFLGTLEGGGTSVKYQTDINIWQLDRSGDKVYGYKIQNAFPSSIGAVTFADDNLDSLTEYSLTFTFSEFEPIENKSVGERIAGIIVGQDTMDTINNVESLFD